MVDGPVGEVVTLMRQRHLVGTKLLDTVTRGLFVLICTYRLPLEEAGRFGLLATVISLLAFALGYERQIDMQRQIAGRSPAAIRKRMADTLRFFRVHYLVVLPVSMLAATWAGVSAWTLTLATIVVIGEHISNQAYQAVLVNPRAFPLLVASSAKNSLQLLAVIFVSMGVPETLSALSIFQVWAIASLGYAAIAAICWGLWMLEPLPPESDELPNQTLDQQYRASGLHFLVGLVAVAALQIDRLVVGGVLSADEVGTYFRHIILTSLAFQIFNIASFNRVAPGVYQHARQSAWQRAVKVVKIEYLRFAQVFTSLVFLALILGYLLPDHTRLLGLQPLFVLIMTGGVLLRTAADYKGLLLLSLGGDQALFRNQASAVLLGATGLFLLSWAFRLPGAFFGAMLTPLFYFLLNRLSVQRRYSQLDNSLP
jgi:hypothetical protein